jgi:hypothetical protein
MRLPLQRDVRLTSPPAGRLEEQIADVSTLLSEHAKSTLSVYSSTDFVSITLRSHGHSGSGSRLSG